MNIFNYKKGLVDCYFTLAEDIFNPDRYYNRAYYFGSIIYIKSGTSFTIGKECYFEKNFSKIVKGEDLNQLNKILIFQ